MTATYRKRVLTYEAIVWDGTDDVAEQIKTWVEVADVDGNTLTTVVDSDDVQDSWNPDLNLYMLPNGFYVSAPHDERCVFLFTPSGSIVVRLGWAIIRGLPNQYDTLSADEFNARYEPVATA